MQDRFGIRTGSKTMPARFESPAKIVMVVDLPIEDDPAGAVLVRDRLIASCSIDDGEAPMPENRRRVREESIPIGSTVSDCARHVRDGCLNRRREEPAESGDTCYATHGRAVSPR
jgi:hypothetical protein